MIGVRTDLEEYRAAVAEFAATTRLGRQAAEIAVVLGGPAWPGAVARAIGAGARAVIVHQPVPDLHGLEELAPTDVPVVLARPGLRADDARDAAPVALPAAVSVQLQTPRGGFFAGLADAVGWARVLAGRELELRGVARDAHAALVDLEPAAGGAGIAVIASERLDARGVMRLRATTVAAERVDVVSNGTVATVTRSSPAGDLVHARRWESVARLALRRAVAAVEEGAVVDDLQEWRHNVALARRAAASAAAAGTH